MDSCGERRSAFSTDCEQQTRGHFVNLANFFRNIKGGKGVEVAGEHFTREDSFFDLLLRN